MSNETSAVARFVVGTDDAEIPEHVFEHARVALLDWFAVAAAGRDEPLVEMLIRHCDRMGGHEQASLLGRSRKTSVAHAALVNGAASHALDYDDTLAAFLGHPSVAIFPGLLALAEWSERSGRDLLAAYLIGLEAGVFVAACAGPEHYLAGWHGTATIGRMAAAAACARLIGLDEQQTLHALGIAGTHASGLKRVLGTMCKPLHAGSAAQGGLVAALLARDGFTSAVDILEGPQGFLDTFGGRRDRTAVPVPGTTWAIEQLAQKYHAACHFAHSPIEAVLRIVKKMGIRVGDIESIRIHCSRVAREAAGKAEPATGLEGKFSIRYSVANALVRGDTGMAAYTDERVDDPAVRAYMERVTVLEDDLLSAPGTAARAELVTFSGQSRELQVDVLREVPGLENKREKVGAKFVDLCEPLFGRHLTARLAQMILSLDRDMPVSRLMEEAAGGAVAEG